MHKFLSFVLCICLVALTQPLLGEAVQRVLVVEYIPNLQKNGGSATKQPLVNVEVQVQGASSTLTNKNGECILRFNTLNIGDRIVARRISKPGYELFYPQVLLNMVIHRDSEPLVLTMISQENLINLSRHTEKMVNAQIEKQKNKELNNLDPAAADYARKRSEIERKYAAKLDDVEQYIDRLIRIDFTNLSTNEKEIAEAYQAGDFESVLEQFDRSNLIEKFKSVTSALHNVENARAKVNKARIEQEKDVREISQYLQYQITMLKMEGSEASEKKAMSLLEKMLDIDPFGHYQMKEYVTMCIQQRNYQHLDSLIRAHLEDPSTNVYYRCRYLSDLGVILYNQMRFDEAFYVLGEAYNMRKNLYRDGLSVSPLSMYHVFCNNGMLGRINMLRGEQDRAVTHFKICFDSYLKLRQLDSASKLYADVTYRDLYTIMTYLRDLGEWALVDSIFTETFPRVQSLFEKGSVRERYIVCAYKMLSVHILHHKGMIKDALQQQLNLLPELSLIYEANHPLCEDLYQDLLRCVTIYQYQNGNYEQVVYYADKWFSVLRDIRSSNKNFENLDTRVFLEMMDRFTEVLTLYAYSLYSIGQNYRTEAIYCEVIDVMENNKDLLKLHPERLAMSYANVSEIRINRGDYESARNMAAKALEINPESSTAKEVLSRLNTQTK